MMVLRTGSAFGSNLRAAVLVPSLLACSTGAAT